MSKGELFVVSGPSGVGKGTLVALLRERVPNIWVSVSATTRSLRPDDKPGITYVFLDDKTFQSMIDADEFLEWAGYTGHFYGTPRKSVDEHRASGNHVILEIDVQGAFQVLEKEPGAHLVFIEPPSMEELERRLRARGTNSEEDIAKRLATAAVELARKEEYDIVITNDDLETAYSEFERYVKDTIEKAEG